MKVSAASTLPNLRVLGHWMGEDLVCQLCGVPRSCLLGHPTECRPVDECKNRSGPPRIMPEENPCATR